MDTAQQVTAGGSGVSLVPWAGATGAELHIFPVGFPEPGKASLLGPAALCWFRSRCLVPTLLRPQGRPAGAGTPRSTSKCRVWPLTTFDPAVGLPEPQFSHL